MTISTHVNIAINVIENTTPAANFGVPMVMGEHTVTANRQDGPYSTLTAFEADGFTSAAVPALHNWASRFFAQRPRAQTMRVGRRAVGEHAITALDAIELAGPANFFSVHNVLNTTDEILATLHWASTRPVKIAMLQSGSTAMRDGTASSQQVSTIEFGGTPEDGDYVIEVRNNFTNTVVGTVTVTRTGGSPAGNDDLAAAARTAWDAVAELAAISEPAAGTGPDLEITFSTAGDSFAFTLTPPGAATLTENTPAFTQNPGTLGAARNYNNGAIWYYENDADALDAAITARCLGFNLDAPAGKGTWVYHALTGVTPTQGLTGPQQATLDGYPVNRYTPVTFSSGTEEPGITWPGQMLSGRFIDTQTTIALTQARMEEAIFRVFRAAAQSSSPQVPFTDPGLQRIGDAALSVFSNLVIAGHYQDQAVSAVSGRITPYVDVPRASTFSSAQRQSRQMTMTAEAVFAPAIHSVGNASTVGFTIDLSF